MKAIKYILLLLSLLILSRCSKANLDMERVDIKGTITSIVTDSSVEDNIASIFVEDNVGSDTAYDKATISITKDTVVLKDNIKVAATTDYLSKNVMVEVQFIGGVARKRTYTRFIL